MNSFSPLALTMGCPVGIGPELLIKLFQRKAAQQENPGVIIGDQHLLTRLLDDQKIPLKIVSWQPGDRLKVGTIPVFHAGTLALDRLRWGKPDAATGKAAGEYISTAIKLALKELVSGIVTCPINKKSMNMGGFNYPGHTEMLADMTGTNHFRMMMAGDRLKVVLVTIHEPLEYVPALVTQAEVRDCIALTFKALQENFALEHPRLAVAGLNPHAGEDGMFGLQEQEYISPAIQECQALGDVTGPWPADTVFHLAASGRFDAVIAMYHDQGLIPFKLLHFEDGVNVTLGLPIVRTSVDHGTAYDLAGTWKASETSLVAAADMALKIVANRLRVQE
ncbi:4-hydroxythreonine-4-phosphate dehydrogenase PdxA [Desulfogranum japonicum]|uniref:4-hydroxythreonine-4-phosphate dehydrogenase PdxA n=1 Tax=Desulfogranum japonicum TaxID=231447 RepID=UPI00040104B0|nr:4-hydroxythreonine-4-phosphate dehydrogenase PdxA [Desulfogranum japonicum]